MNTKIYNKLVALAKEILNDLKCTDKNICLSAREISTFFEHKKAGNENIYNWGVWFALPDLRKRYTITVDSFTCTFDPEKYFTLLYKFEQLTNTPLKDRFVFVFGDGSERKEKVSTLYYDVKEGRTIAKEQLLHLLNNKIAIREKGNAAKVFICVPGAGFEWYEIMSFSDYKKKIEYYKEYLTTNYYDIVVSHLQRWQSCEGNKYNDIYLKIQDQLRANQVATDTTTTANTGSDGGQAGTAATHDSDTDTTNTTNTTTGDTASDESQAATTAATHDSDTTTANTGSDGSQAGTAATHDSDTTTATTTAATPGSDGGQAAAPTAAPPRIKAKLELPTPPPTPKPTAAARGAPYIYFYAIS